MSSLQTLHEQNRARVINYYKMFDVNIFQNQESLSQITFSTDTITSYHSDDEQAIVKQSSQASQSASRREEDRSIYASRNIEEDEIGFLMQDKHKSVKSASASAFF